MKILIGANCLFLAMALAACRTPNSGSSVKGEPVLSAEGEPAPAASGGAVASRAFWVEAGQVKAGDCSSLPQEKQMTKADFAGCKVLKQVSVADFKASFKKLYLESSKQRSFSKNNEALLDAGIAAAAIDGSVKPTLNKSIKDAELTDLISKYYSVIEAAVGLEPNVVQSSGEGGLNLASAQAFIQQGLVIPFGQISVSPTMAVGQVLTKQIRARFSPACGAQITGVNIGQTQFNMGFLKNLGGGNFVSNIPGKTLDIRFLNITASQVFSTGAACTLVVEKIVEDQPQFISGFDFNGQRSCLAIDGGTFCAAVVSPEQEACGQVNGTSGTCSDCSSLCSKPISNNNGNANWQLAGHIVYGGGFAPAVEVPVNPAQFVKEVRIDNPSFCQGAQVLSVKVRPAFGITFANSTVQNSQTIWSPNGGNGGTISGIVASLNGPLIFNACNIPVFINNSSGPVPVGLPIFPNPPTPLGLPIFPDEPFPVGLPSEPPPVAVGLPIFPEPTIPLGLPIPNGGN